MIMRGRLVAIIPSLLITALVGCQAISRTEPSYQSEYFPAAGQWEHRSPEQVGIDAERLSAAIDFAIANESTAPRDLEQNHYLSFGLEPHGEPIGPFKTRGEMTGIVLRHGYIVAEWGEPRRVDMTFSVTKSFLSSTVGLAWDQGLIRNLHEPVANYVPTDHFESAHNARVTWDHLLRQTSDWQGTLWGKPDWADRPPDDVPLAEHVQRARHTPGSVWRRPLPQVLRQYLMDPIGASNTWRWYGYENSWVIIDGLNMQSVSGGGHWGGGMWLSARDQARFGYLTLRRGRWRDRQILSDEWVTRALTPTPAEPGYGFMNWFLNTERQRLPAAPETAFFHLGAGTNMIYVDPDNDLVVVVRWISRNATNAFVEKVLAALQDD